MTASSIAVPVSDGSHADPAAESSASPNFLRIVAAGEAPQHEQLSPGRISIGSSPRCTIRVAGPGVQPLHCTLQVDEQGARCRSWGSDVRRNGETFHSTVLQAGDVLQLGVVQLVAVEQPDDPIDPERMARAWAGPHVGIRTAGDASRPPLLERSVRPDATTLARIQFSDRLVCELAQANQTARQRLRRCLASLRSTRQEAAAMADSIADLENRLGESWKEQSQQRELCDRLQQQAAKAAEAVEALEQIEVLSAQLGEVEAALETTQSELAERTAANQTLAERNAELESSLACHSKTAERIAALKEQFREAQRLSENREQQLSALNQERDDLEAQLLGFQAEAAEQRERAERLAAELGDVQAQDHEAIVAATARCRELTDQAEQTAQRLNEVAAESQRRADDLKDLRQQQRVWESERLDMEARLADQASRIAALTAEQARAAEEPDPREEQLLETEQQCSELKRQLAASREEAAATEQRRRELEGQADDLREQLEQAASRLASAESQLGKARSEAEQAYTQLSQVQEDDQAGTQRLADAVARADALAAELETVRSENERLAAAATEAQQAAEAFQSTLAEERARANVESPPPIDEAEATAEQGAVAINEAVAAAEAVAETDATAPEATEDSDDEVPTSYAQPTSFFEQYKHLLPDDDEPVDAPGPAVVEEPTRPPLLSGGDDEDAESLERYMAEMMQRVRSSAPAATASFAPTPIAPPPKPKPAWRDAEAKESDVAEEAAVEPIDLEQLRSSSQKPPLPTDLVALRNLANNAARKAIATSHQRRDLEVLASKLVICVVAVAASAYLIAAGESWQSPLTITGGIIALAGAYAGFQFATRLVQAWRLRRAASDDGSEERAEGVANADDQQPLGDGTTGESP